MIRRTPRSTRTDTLFPYTTLFLSMLFAVQVIVPRNFQLDLGHRLDFVRKPRGIDELGIDLGEIHEVKVEPGEFLDRKAKALLLLGSAPGLAELNSSLLLQDAAELAFKAAIGRSPGLADSEKARRTVSADLVAEAHKIGRESCRERVCQYC